MNKVQIYALVNPVKQEPFYVGATISPLKTRLSQHLSRMQYTPGETALRRRKLINELIKKKTPPKIILLATCNENEVDHFESYYYNLFLSAGFDMIQKNNSFVYEKQYKNKFSKNRLLKNKLMPIGKGQYGKHESILQVQFGVGDIRMDKAQYPVDKPTEVHLIISQGEKGEIGREDNDLLGKTTDDIEKPEVVLVFDKPESINSMIHSLVELQRDLLRLKA